VNLKTISAAAANPFSKSSRVAFFSRNLGLLLVAVLGVPLLVSCQRSATVVTSVAYFPSNSTWNAATFRVVVQARGELDAEYTHVGEKHVTIIVSDQKMERAKTQHVIKAGDLVWTIAWKELQDLEITFSEKAGQAHRQLTAIRFVVDSHTHDVTEVKPAVYPIAIP
jgi:hypothetical protein